MQIFFQDQNAIREIISSSEYHLSSPQLSCAPLYCALEWWKFWFSMYTSLNQRTTMHWLSWRNLNSKGLRFILIATLKKHFENFENPWMKFCQNELLCNLCTDLLIFAKNSILLTRKNYRLHQIILHKICHHFFTGEFDM